MTRLDIPLLARDAAAIVTRHGGRATLDIGALAILIVTADALLRPDLFVAARTSGTEVGPLSLLLDPFLMAHEAAFAILFGAACLRVADETRGEAGRPTGARLKHNAAPLIVTMIALGFASYFGLMLLILPALLLTAVTTTAYPAILVEGRGWGGLSHSIAQCGPHLLRLTAAWSVLLVPFLVVLLSMVSEAPEGTSVTSLWLTELKIELVQTLLNVLSLGLIMAAYRQLGEDADADRLNDIFD